MLWYRHAIPSCDSQTNIILMSFRLRLTQIVHRQTVRRIWRQNSTAMQQAPCAACVGLTVVSCTYHTGLFRSYSVLPVNLCLYQFVFANIDSCMMEMNYFYMLSCSVGAMWTFERTIDFDRFLLQTSRFRFWFFLASKIWTVYWPNWKSAYYLLEPCPHLRL